jgi:hypothetical protein
MPKSVVFEVSRKSAWKKIGVAEAIEKKERRGRCVECHEPVRVHRRSKNKTQAAHVEHLEHNRKCSLSDQRYVTQH